MRRALTFTLLLTLLAVGCETKKQADTEARLAYMQGQQQAAKQWQSQRPMQVVVQGPVHYPVVPWEDDLMLSKAIVTAEYTGFLNPKLVRVVRDGQMIEELKGVDLLHGQDLPLQPGDIIVLVP